MFLLNYSDFLDFSVFLADKDNCGKNGFCCHLSTFVVSKDDTNFDVKQCGVSSKMSRILFFCSIALCIPLFSGCKMCASSMDDNGSPVRNSSASNYMRAGSVYGGYSGNNNIGVSSTTAQPKAISSSPYANSTGLTSGQDATSSPTLLSPRTVTPPHPRTIESGQVVPATPMPDQFSTQQLLRESPGATNVRILNVQDSAMATPVTANRPVEQVAYR